VVSEGEKGRAQKFPEDEYSSCPAGGDIPDDQPVGWEEEGNGNEPRRKELLLWYLVAFNPKYVFKRRT